MHIKIYKDHHALSTAAADEIITLLKDKPEAVICLASGHTPQLACELFVVETIKNKIDLSRFTFIGLDEWVGIPPEYPGTCHDFFRNELFRHLSIPAHNIHLFNGMSRNLADECAKMDKVIAAKGGIDLMIVGIGMNGHIGFNEPGVPFELYSHVIELDEVTRTVGQKYFQDSMNLHQGITIGLQHLQETERVLLMANGRKKAELIFRTVKGEITNAFPASIMQTHPNGVVMVDEEAGYLLDS
jgi:glucosamine-6-phosphate isomerase